MLVWSSWARDSNVRRFFQRRCLRIFPALWLVVILSIGILGPVLTTVSLAEYFSAADTWRYLTTAILIPRNVLPGVFETNPFPHVINGSLWTLPVEFLCYITVAAAGLLREKQKGFPLGLVLVMTVLLATYAPLLVGARFSPHFEMLAIFWWGALYAYFTAGPWRALKNKQWELLALAIALLIFALLGPRSAERLAITLFAMAAVFLAQRTDLGARLTDRIGDLSYGIYIYAFPVQQLVVYWLGASGKSLAEMFLASSVITLALAYLSWHLVERQALRFKPRAALSP
jgi:peptidoglycan/LPS O-acetylase OafA/YrhL